MNPVTDQEKLNSCLQEIETLQLEIEKTRLVLERKCKFRDKLLLQINSENLKNPEWVFRNPTLPGAHEATNDLMNDLYGGPYNGPHPSGYHHDGDYNPIQKNFDFCLSDHTGDNKETLKKNCTHFVENFLKFLDPVVTVCSQWDDRFPEMKVVPFQFRSESSGLDYLGYNPADGNWYHFTLVYGISDIKQIFYTFDDAFEFAYQLANQPENEY